MIKVFIMIVLCITIGVVISILIQEHQHNQDNKERYARYLNKHYSYYDSQGHKYYFKDKPGKDMARISFARFQTLYSVSPEKWTISNELSAALFGIPVYVSNNIAIPIFWSSPEDLEKYEQWIQNEYLAGNSKLHQEKQDQDLKQLLEFIQEDIAQDREEFQRWSCDIWILTTFLPVELT